MSWAEWIVVAILFVVLMGELKKIVDNTREAAEHLRFLAETLKRDRKIK